MRGRARRAQRPAAAVSAAQPGALQIQVQARVVWPPPTSPRLRCSLLHGLCWSTPHLRISSKNWNLALPQSPRDLRTSGCLPPISRKMKLLKTVASEVARSPREPPGFGRVASGTLRGVRRMVPWRPSGCVTSGAWHQPKCVESATARGVRQRAWRLGRGVRESAWRPRRGGRHALWQTKRTLADATHLSRHHALDAAHLAGRHALWQTPRSGRHALFSDARTVVDATRTPRTFPDATPGRHALFWKPRPTGRVASEARKPRALGV